MTKKGRKILLVILASIIIILLALILSLNLIMGKIINNTIDNQLELMSEQTDKYLSVEKVRFNIFSRTISIKNIIIKPDSSLIENLKHGKLDHVSVTDIKIASLKLQGFDIYELLIDRNLILKKIILKGSNFTIYKNENRAEVVEDENASPPFSVDSIYIEGLNRINLSKVVVDNYTYTIVKVNSNDTVFSFGGSDFEIKGLALESSENTKGFFRFNNEKLSLKMRQQRIDLKNANYFIYLKKLDFSFSDSIISIDNLKVKPTKDKYKLGASYKYTKEVFDVEVKSTKIYGYNIGTAIRHGIFEIDSVLIDGLNIDLYKDRTRPFDLEKRPLFIQEQLKHLELPLHISKILISNSKFTYEMRPEGSKKLLHVNITKINADMGFITSIKDSLQSGKRLRINLSGQLMGVSSLDLKIIMPYNSAVDTFYFSGTLGSADFAKFNPALYPATGIKFKGGKLNSMKFYANASPKSAKGLMTMLYDDLEAEIPKKDAKESNKFLSFGANAVLRTSNPNKKGKTRIALIQNDRIEYKGFGNLLWKSVQSGLVNTILPTGKSHKEEKKNKNKGNNAPQENLKKKWWKKEK